MMNLEKILLISIAILPLTLTVCVLIVKRGVYWINGQAIIPAPNQTINIVSISEVNSSDMHGLVGRYTKVLSFFGSLRIDPNLEFSKLLFEELGIIIAKDYIQKRFTIDLVDLNFLNSTAINEIIKFLLTIKESSSVEIKIVFPQNRFNAEFNNFDKLFSNNKNITIERASHVSK
jgi:hypothetical protein